jgi:hypothetical protein
LAPKIRFSKFLTTFLRFSASDLPPYDEIAIDNVALEIEANDLHSIVFLIVDVGIL